MYEAIELHSDDFNNLQELLADPNAGQRLIDLERALQQSAQAVSDVQGGNELDRSNRGKIYLGLLAASRIVARLRELELVK